MIYIHDCDCVPPKMLFAWDYPKYLNDDGILLLSIKWAVQDSGIIMGFSEKALAIATRGPNGTSPIFCKNLSASIGNGILINAEFLAFASNCKNIFLGKNLDICLNIKEENNTILILNWQNSVIIAKFVPFSPEYPLLK